MSISNLLLTARDSLFAHGMTIDITGGIFANVDTSGYTRQREDMRSAGSANTGEGKTHICVVIGRVEHIYHNYRLAGKASLSELFSH